MFKKIEPFGESAILISWENVISQCTRHEIFVLKQKIEQAKNTTVVETVPAFCSLTLYLNTPNAIAETIDWLKKLDSTDIQTPTIKSQTWQIPVCYDEIFGIDLSTLATLNKISIEQIIHLHTEVIYTVNFIGFLPGFPYLSGLNAKLYTPRLTKPRAKIPQGSVAIGGKQTGIYPIESPGGWHIIGQTPLRFFDPTKQQPCFIKPLDKIKFNSINLQEFEEYCHD